MAQKKETAKKDVKVQDLAPKKDAKGGRFSAGANRGANANLNATGVNTSTNATNENRSLSGNNYNAD